MRIGFVGVRDGRLVRRLAAAGVRVFACWTDDLAGDARIALLSDAVAVARADSRPSAPSRTCGPNAYPVT